MKKKNTKKAPISKSKLKRPERRTEKKQKNRTEKKSEQKLEVNTTSPKKLPNNPVHAKLPKSVPPNLAPPTAPRAPLRKIMGANNALTIVPSSSTNEIEAVPVPTPPPPKEESKTTPEMPKYLWNDLPGHAPTYVRFLVSMAKKECDNALSWPFPFAKYIAALPEEICGLDFAFLLLSLEHDTAEVARISKLDVSLVERALERGVLVMREKFSNMCGDMDRKLRTQLAGRGMKVESLIEHYLVAKVDRNFQVAIGTILLKDMRARNNQVQQEVAHR